MTNIFAFNNFGPINKSTWIQIPALILLIGSIAACDSKSQFLDATMDSSVDMILDLSQPDLIADDTLVPDITEPDTTEPDAQVPSWPITAGGMSGEMGQGINVNSNGDVYITGNFDGETSFGSTTLTGDYDIFLAKYGQIGNLIWAKSTSGPERETVRKMAMDQNGNVYLIGEFEKELVFGSQTLSSNGYDDMFVAKYDSSGQITLAFSAGGKYSEMSRGITVDNTGNIYVTGGFLDTATFGSTTLSSRGAYEIFTAKYSSSGTLIWAKSAGGTSTDYTEGVAVDQSGNVYIAGHFSGQLALGTLGLSSLGLYDFFIAKYDGAGTGIWAKSAGGTNMDQARTITIDALGNIYVVGVFFNQATFGTQTFSSLGKGDIFISKYDGTGTVLWSESAGGVDIDEPYDLATNTNNNLLITGEFKDKITFGTTTLVAVDKSDVFVAEYDSAGTLVRAKSAGGTYDDSGQAITSDTTGNIFVTGGYQFKAYFDGELLWSQGTTDIFIWKINSTP